MKLSTLRVPCASLSSTLALIAIAALFAPGVHQVCAQESSQTAAKASDPIRQTRVVKLSSIPAGQRSQLRQTVPARTNLAPVNTGTGIVFTCDPNIPVAHCSYLNETVGANLNGSFTNANAAVYILYGATGLGSSTQYINFITYNQFVGALSANPNKSPAQTTALASLNTFDSGPYGAGKVEVTAALGTMLGFPGSVTGITAPPNATSCTLGTPGCYDLFVTVTNDPNTPIYYDEQGGTEAPDAYDFYSVVAHEVNEALGTSSCIGSGSGSLVDGCGAGVPSAVDLFRYNSAGTLDLVTAPNNTPGQYFSYDGGSTNPGKGVGGTALYYNNLSDGGDYADYLSSDPCQANYAIQDAQGCPGNDAGRSILNDGGSEIAILNVLGYIIPETVTTAIPTFTPAAGTYATTQSVTIADATTGAVIYYTLDATTPTASSTRYVGAISVATTETIQAIAVLNSVSSSVASSAYTITATTAPTLTLTVSSNAIEAGQTLNYTIAVNTNGGAAATGSVTLSSQQGTIGTVQLSNGTYSSSSQQLTTPGTYTFNAKYSGDSNYPALNATPVTVVVRPFPFTLQLVGTGNPQSGTVKAGASFGYSVMIGDGKGPALKGELGFYTSTNGSQPMVIGGVPITGSQLVNGDQLNGAYALSTPGTYTVYAFYVNDANYAGVAAPVPVTITVQ